MASSHAVTCRTTPTGRRSPPPARAAWPPSTPSAGSKPSTTADAKTERVAGSAGIGVVDHRLARVGAGGDEAVPGRRLFTWATTRVFPVVASPANGDSA